PPPQDEPSTLLAIDPSILSPLVRFPPHTALAHTLGSAIQYDRSPIVVAPNRCALPARGCPGRTYDDLPPAAASSSSAAYPRRSKRNSLSPTGTNHLHPRAVSDQRPDDDPTPRQSPRVLDHHPLPPLVPDFSSSSSESSEESDGVASPPPDFYSAPPYAGGKLSLEQSLMNLTLAGTNAPSTSALSFLPHPPSPRVRPSHSPSTSLSYAPALSNPPNSAANANAGGIPSNPAYANHHRRPSASPVRSRSPSSPTHRRKSRPAPSTPAASNPMPIPSPASYAQHASYPSPASAYAHAQGAPASPERERRSRHPDDPASAAARGRDRSRDRRERERAERLARYKSLSEASSRMGGFGYEDSGCLGGF
ncbi:hypothetical protein C8Q80DRAFT_1135800, partial [Daedaleopsis nitida]